MWGCEGARGKVPGVYHQGRMSTGNLDIQCRSGRVVRIQRRGAPRGQDRKQRVFAPEARAAAERGFLVPVFADARPRSAFRDERAIARGYHRGAIETPSSRAPIVAGGVPHARCGRHLDVSAGVFDEPRARAGPRGGGRRRRWRGWRRGWFLLGERRVGRRPERGPQRRRRAPGRRGMQEGGAEVPRRAEGRHPSPGDELPARNRAAVSRKTQDGGALPETRRALRRAALRGVRKTRTLLSRDGRSGRRRGTARRASCDGGGLRWGMPRRADPGAARPRGRRLLAGRRDGHGRGVGRGRFDRLRSRPGLRAPPRPPIRIVVPSTCARSSSRTAASTEMRSKCSTDSPS